MDAWKIIDRIAAIIGAIFTVIGAIYVVLGYYAASPSTPSPTTPNYVECDICKGAIAVSYAVEWHALIYKFLSSYDVARRFVYKNEWLSMKASALKK